MAMGAERSITRGKTKGLADDMNRLREVLRRKGGGCVLRGWRKALDPDGTLKVGIKDFNRAIANMGLTLDATRMFTTDDDPQHFSLDELAPVQALLLNRFREWVKKQFGGPAGMFTAFDVDGLEYIDREGFINGCREGKFRSTAEDCQELFNCMDFDAGGSVTMDEVMFLELDPIIREQEMFKLKMRSRFQRQRLRAFAHWEDTRRFPPTHRRAQRPWLANEFENLPVFMVQRRLEHYQELYRRSVKARVAFLQELRDSHSNEVRAWRRSLDPDAKFAVSKVVLRQYLRQRDLDLVFDDLWRGMDRDNDQSICLEEITPAAGLQLALFRCWAHDRFGSCAGLWDTPAVAEAREAAIESGRWASDKKMMVPVLADIVKKLGWPSDANSVLYQSLDLYGCGFISLPDLWWLDLWQPPEWLVKRPDPQALIELQSCVHVMCSHPLVAWRGYLDMDSDNLVSWVEFVAGCKKLKFTGNVGGAWRMLDKDVSGSITLREWDPKGAELLDSFKRWAEAHFGSAELAFKAFDKEGSGVVSLQELRSTCRRLKWDGDVKALFQCLSSKRTEDQKARTLVLKDIVFLDKWVDHDVLKWALHQMDGGPPGSDPKLFPSMNKSRSASTLDASGRLEPRAPVRKQPSSRELWLQEMSAASEKGPASPSASAAKGGGPPVSKEERLLRRYQVLAYSKKKRPWESHLKPTRSMSASSLPWLEKINRIDEAFVASHATS